MIPQSNQENEKSNQSTYCIDLCLSIPHIQADIAPLEDILIVYRGKNMYTTFSFIDSAAIILKTHVKSHDITFNSNGARQRSASHLGSDINKKQEIAVWWISVNGKISNNKLTEVNCNAVIGKMSNRISPDILNQILLVLLRIPSFSSNNDNINIEDTSDTVTERTGYNVLEAKTMFRVKVKQNGISLILEGSKHQQIKFICDSILLTLRPNSDGFYTGVIIINNFINTLGDYSDNNLWNFGVQTIELSTSERYNFSDSVPGYKIYASVQKPHFKLRHGAITIFSRVLKEFGEEIAKWSKLSVIKNAENRKQEIFEHIADVRQQIFKNNAEHVIKLIISDISGIIPLNPINDDNIQHNYVLVTWKEVSTLIKVNDINELFMRGQKVQPMRRGSIDLSNTNDYIRRSDTLQVGSIKMEELHASILLKNSEIESYTSWEEKHHSKKDYLKLEEINIKYMMNSAYSDEFNNINDRSTQIEIIANKVNVEFQPENVIILFQLKDVFTMNDSISDFQETESPVEKKISKDINEHNSRVDIILKFGDETNGNNKVLVKTELDAVEIPLPLISVIMMTNDHYIESNNTKEQLANDIYLSVNVKIPDMTFTPLLLNVLDLAMKEYHMQNMVIDDFDDGDSKMLPLSSNLSNLSIKNRSRSSSTLAKNSPSSDDPPANIVICVQILPFSITIMAKSPNKEGEKTDNEEVKILITNPIEAIISSGVSKYIDSYKEDSTPNETKANLKFITAVVPIFSIQSSISDIYCNSFRIQFSFGNNSEDQNIKIITLLLQINSIAINGHLDKAQQFSRFLKGWTKEFTKLKKVINGSNTHINTDKAIQHGVLSTSSNIINYPKISFVGRIGSINIDIDVTLKAMIKMALELKTLNCHYSTVGYYPSINKIEDSTLILIYNSCKMSITGDERYVIFFSTDKMCFQGIADRKSIKNKSSRECCPYILFQVFTVKFNIDLSNTYKDRIKREDKKKEIASLYFKTLAAKSRENKLKGQAAYDILLLSDEINAAFTADAIEPFSLVGKLLYYLFYILDQN